MIDIVYEELRALGAVRSGADFCRNWLGRERSYLRGLHAKQRGPSPQVLVTCAVRLLRSAERLSASRLLPAQTKGRQLRSLANMCLEEILAIGGRS